MKLFLILFLFILTLQHSVSGKNFIINNAPTNNFQDTTAKIRDSINATIDEVIKSPTLPKAEKVQYVNQVTKYGFKSLFKNFSYNPSMPYSSQVNPYAETYMQDYLQAHGPYLQKMKTLVTVGPATLLLMYRTCFR